MLNQASLDFNKCVQILPKHISSVEDQFWEIENQFEFNYQANNISGKNNYGIIDKKGNQISVIPLLYEYWLKNCKILTYEELISLADSSKWSPGGYAKIVMAGIGDKEQKAASKIALLCKLRNLWTGWLREIHVRIFLQKYDPYGTFWYDAYADTCRSIDIFYKRSLDDRLFGISVKHVGNQSAYWSKYRKDAKRSVWVLEFNALPNKLKPKGLDVVDPEIMLNLVCGLLDYNTITEPVKTS